ncbi:hypothetical protein ACNJ7E_43530 [Rhodococcus sp. NM-2]|uniref:hypothetical protein n=1 Tax=Rhodococcus sp. NM-2 TaxID=3401174 RepID=UPI003AB09E1E
MKTQPKQTVPVDTVDREDWEHAIDEVQRDYSTEAGAQLREDEIILARAHAVVSLTDLTERTERPAPRRALENYARAGVRRALGERIPVRRVDLIVTAATVILMGGIIAYFWWATVDFAHIVARENFADWVPAEAQREAASSGLWLAQFGGVASAVLFAPAIVLLALAVGTDRFRTHPIRRKARSFCMVALSVEVLFSVLTIGVLFGVYLLAAPGVGA